MTCSILEEEQEEGEQEQGKEHEHQKEEEDSSSRRRRRWGNRTKRQAQEKSSIKIDIVFKNAPLWQNCFVLCKKNLCGQAILILHKNCVPVYLELTVAADFPSNQFQDRMCGTDCEMK